MKYTDNKEQVVFLKDGDIAVELSSPKSVSGYEILSNGVPSYDLFKKTYDELSSYDNNLSSTVRSLCTVISSESIKLSAEVSALREKLYGLNYTKTFQTDNDVSIITNVYQHEGQISVTSKKLTSADVSELDTYVQDSIRKLSGETYSTFFKLSGDNNISGNNTFLGFQNINQLCSEGIYVDFRNVNELYKYKLSDFVEVDNYFESLYNAILNIKNILSLSTDFNLGMNIREAFDAIQGIANEVGVDISPFNPETANVRDGFIAAKKIIYGVNVEITKTLRDIINDIDARFDINEKSIARINLKLSSLTDNFNYVSSDFNERITDNRNDINGLSGKYDTFHNGTFIPPFSSEECHDISSERLILTDENMSGSSHTSKHDRYYMTFKEGTIVMVKMNN